MSQISTYTSRSAIAGPEAYRLRFFIDNGFQRRKCTSCGRFFWTLDPDGQLCGDSPCAPYSFIKNPPTNRSFTIKEMREEFLSFFEMRGHARVRRYPVVARWRDDIFLTIASIACFQPHVTSGEVPPPYNPLTISQPCIRMNDLDNVGKTGGRHLSIFEMMAHHAFNSKEKQIYWKDDTVRYHHEFLTKDLGINEREITYIEHWWEGGGNAGPDLEGIVRGMEVSTLVFMQYLKTEGGYQELPLKIVDTGYGLERFTWLSQGTPMSFQAVYGRLFDDFIGMASLEVPDPEILSATTRLSGIMNVVDEGSLKKVRKQVADLLGRDVTSLEHELEPMENLTAILDHTKALAFMLSDGIVPSNAGAGYLARLMIRRIKRLMDCLRIKVPLSEMLRMQIGYWVDQFPELSENIDYVTKVADLEVERYVRTIDQGRELVLRLINDRKISGASSIPLEKLVELYDSNGLPPEIVKEVGESQGIATEIPDTFDTMIAEMHSKARSASAAAGATASEDEKLFEGLPELPPTTLVFYAQPKLQRLTAKVLYSDRKRIVLDRTIFYPEGGGQLSDTGLISTAAEGVEGDTFVMGADKCRGVVVHKVQNGSRFRQGDEVECTVDWTRRTSLARHHSSTHILLGAARKILGTHVWQMGAQKAPDRSRVDISHFEKLTQNQLREIELLANRVVEEDRPVNTFFEERNTAELKYGFGLYQGGVVYGTKLRLVEVAGWDIEACGGIHVQNTGEIGVIKIMKSERIQDGVERIEFVSGEPALKFIQSEESVLQEVARTINTPVERLERAAMKLAEDFTASKKEADRLRKILAGAMAPSIVASAETVGTPGLKFIHRVMEGMSCEDLLPISSKIVQADPLAVVLLAAGMDGSLLVLAGSEAVAAGANAGSLVREAAMQLKGRGGGKQDIGQGKVQVQELGNFGEAASKVRHQLGCLGQKQGN